MTIKAIIFDLGDVIFRTQDTALIDSFASTIGLTGKELNQKVFGGPSAQRAFIGEIDELEHWKYVVADLGLPSEMLSGFKDIFYKSPYEDKDLLKFINGLRPKYKTGLLSNAWSNARNYFESYTDVLNVFDVSVFSAEVKMAKPDFAIYSHILNLMSVMPFESIFVDDNIKNIVAAREVGMLAFQFITPQQTQSRILEMLKN